ncbi:MAG TPA: hypothetical protein ENL42_06555 [Thermoplasmatales archaeon]|nr:hypothetical protein [Thermoplasmatales archaeon]
MKVGKLIAPLLVFILLPVFASQTQLYDSLNPKFEYGKYLDKKYHCLHEFNLYGDPAFNPWNP